MSLVKRLNDLPIFDPSRLPGREFLARFFGITLVTAFIVRRVVQLPDWPGTLAGDDWGQRLYEAFSFLPEALRKKPFDMEASYAYYGGYSHGRIVALWWMELSVWIAETAILLGYVLALLTRVGAKVVARGFVETVFPLLLAGLPFTVVMTDYTYRDWVPVRSVAHWAGLIGINAILIAGGAANVAGVLTLRRGFTVMTEARVFVRSGLYRFVRHPMYAAHFVIYFCYTLLHFHAITAVLYVLFVMGQTLRARVEERKLTAAFPEYEEYRRTTGMFFPRFRR